MLFLDTEGDFKKLTHTVMEASKTKSTRWANRLGTQKEAALPSTSEGCLLAEFPLAWGGLTFALFWPSADWIIIIRTRLGEMRARGTTLMTCQERDPIFSQRVGQGLTNAWEVSGSVGRRKEGLEHSKTRCSLGESCLGAEEIGNRRTG